MSAPYEVVVGPYTVWLAPTGTSFPATNGSPSGSWFKLGTSGAKNYSEKGVTVTHSQTIGTFTPAGGTAARKAFRTAEGITVDFELADLTPEQYAEILNGASVATAAGPPAIKTVQLEQGLSVSTFAMLVRGASPVNDTLNAQYQLPIVYQSGNPAPVYTKGSVAMLACKFDLLEDASLLLGSWVAQTA